VSHPGVPEFRVRADGSGDKPAEEGGRRGAVEAMVVIKNPFQHE
jgi:hypothetical protein